jgi:hypothetical protein
VNAITRGGAVRLNIDVVDHFSIDKVSKAFEQGNAIGFVGCAYSTHGMLALVWDNIPALRDRGIYEAALVEALIGCKGNNRGWSISALKTLFHFGDRKKLLAAGQPLPGAGPFTVYRGVSGEKPFRRINSLSWTSSLDVACWFAKRNALKDPAVYRAKLNADDVFCFKQDRGEMEFIGCPRSCKLHPMTATEIDASAQRRSKLIKARDDAELKAMIKVEEARQAAMA